LKTHQILLHQDIEIFTGVLLSGERYVCWRLFSHILVKISEVPGTPDREPEPEPEPEPERAANKKIAPYTQQYTHCLIHCTSGHKMVKIHY
jgi:hypothetical protein